MKSRFDEDASGHVSDKEIKIGLRKIRWMATVKTLILLILVIYPGLATRVFSILRCQLVNEVYVLQQDFNVVCYTGEHNMYLILAIAFMIVYIFGIPGMVLFTLWRNRKHLHDESSPKHEVVDHEFGGLYKQYEKEYWWFEVVVIVHKMFMTGMLSIIAPGTPVQMVAAILIMQSFLLVVLKNGPFKTDMDDVSVFSSSLALVLTTMCGLVLFLDPTEQYFHREPLGIGIIVLNCSVLLLQISVLIFVKCGYGSQVVKLSRRITGRTQVVPIGGGDEKGTLIQDVQDVNILKDWGESKKTGAGEWT